MAGDTAFVTQYRDEFTHGFEQNQSVLKSMINSDAQAKGNQAVFDIVDSGGATAVTRGVNGRIPSRTDNENQITVTLQEWHDKPIKTGFNIFASQGDGRRKMQETTRSVMNRKIDDDIIGALGLAANQYVGAGGNASSAYPATLALIESMIAKLARQDVDVDDPTKLIFLATPSFRAELYQLPTFNSHDYVDVKPLVGPVRKMVQWAGAMWLFSNRLAGVGTAAEKVVLFHRDALGHCVNTGDMQVVAGYNEEDDYSFARSTIFMGSQILQQKGLVYALHDGSAIG